MLVSDIITLAETQADESYEDAVWIQYINMALEELTPVVKLLTKKDSVNVSLTSGVGSIALTGGSKDADLAKAHEILSVFFTVTTPTPGAQAQLRMLSLKDNSSTGWKLTNDAIYVQGMGTSTAGTVRVDYYKKLTPVSTTADDLETVAGLPSQYHHLLVLYCVAKSRQKEEEIQGKQDVFGDFLKSKSQMALERIWAMEPHNRKFIRKARISSLLGG